MLFSDKRRDRPGRQRFPKQFLNFRQSTLVGIAHQRPRPPRRPGAAHTANAVHVVLSVNRQVHHHHIPKAGNVHAARRDIGCHQQLHFLPAECVHRRRPLSRRHPPVRRCRRMALHRDVFDKLLNRLLRRDKDQSLPDVAFGQHQIQHLKFVLVTVAEDQVVHDRIRNGVRFSQTNVRGVLCDGQRQLPHAFGQGRGVEARLPLGATGARNSLNLLAKANVQHAIRFINDQGFQPKHCHAVGIQMVDQTPGRRNHQIERPLQGFVLSGIGLTAQHPHSPHLLARKNIARHIPQLLTQLSGGRQDNRARTGARALGRQRQAREQRQQKGQRLSRPRRGRGNHVATPHKRRDGFALNVGWGVQRQPGHGVKGTHVQTQRLKLGQGVVFFEGKFGGFCAHFNTIALVERFKRRKKNAFAVHAARRCGTMCRLDEAGESFNGDGTDMKELISRRRVFELGAGATLTVSLIGCETATDLLNLAQPTMRVQDIALKSVGLNQQTVGIDTAINNPNPLSLLINQLAMNFNLAGKDLGTATLGSPVELGANRETSVGLDYSTNLIELLGNGLSDLQVSGTGGIPYELAGNANLSRFNLPVPLKYQGSVNLNDLAPMLGIFG